MSFKVANSSFILERRRRSIKLCAVFRAILRPAADVALGCFFLDPLLPFGGRLPADPDTSTLAASADMAEAVLLLFFIEGPGGPTGPDLEFAAFLCGDCFVTADAPRPDGAVFGFI